MLDKIVKWQKAIFVVLILNILILLFAIVIQH